MQNLKALAVDREAVLSQAFAKKRHLGNPDTVGESLLLIGDGFATALREVAGELRGLREGLAALAGHARVAALERSASAQNRASRLVTALVALVDACPKKMLEGTAGEILARLGIYVDDDLRRSRLWPRSPRALSVAMRRLAPDLRSAGVQLEQGTGAARRVWTLRRVTPEMPEVPI